MKSEETMLIKTNNLVDSYQITYVESALVLALALATIILIKAFVHKKLAIGLAVAAVGLSAHMVVPLTGMDALLVQSKTMSYLRGFVWLMVTVVLVMEMRERFSRKHRANIVDSP